MSPSRIYGPVPSRRLGLSLGLDLVPWKTCTYDCLYCQLGPTTCRTLERGLHVRADELLAGLERALESGVRPDFISLAGSGEPTLNLELGATLRGIRKLTAIPVAVLTNGALLHRPDVRRELEAADLVLPSLDAGDEGGFQRINRPASGLSFQAMVDGLASFTASFSGEVWLEVMLVAGHNDGPEELRRIARLAEGVSPARIQLNTVERPAAGGKAEAVPEEGLLAALDLFPPGTELIAGRVAAPAERFCSEDPESALIELLERRPCRAEEAAMSLAIAPLELLKHLQRLQASGQIESVRQQGQRYFRVLRQSR